MRDIGSDWDGVVIRMAERKISPPRLLVVDDDSDLRLFLQDLLTEEGYDVDVGATLDEALALIDTHVYHLILTDLLTHTLSDPLRSAATVRQAAHPTPIVALTGWNITAADVAQAGLARLISKPFDLDELLDAIASCLETPLSAEQRRQAEVVGHYCDAFNAHDFDTCLALCADDVRFDASAPQLTGPTGRLVGQATMRAVLQHMLLYAPDMRMDDYLIHPQTKGLALRCMKSWIATAAPDGRTSMPASMFFQFSGERITQISLSMDGQNWHALSYDTPSMLGVQPGLN